MTGPGRAANLQPVTMPRMRRPAARPCRSCPYRADVESGIWAAQEYDKLVDYDAPTGAQPVGAFACHQRSADDPRVRVCAGWAHVHNRNPRGHELLALRVAVPFGNLSEADTATTAAYSTDVPCFASGTAAAEHGRERLDNPSAAALLLQAKIRRARPDVHGTDGPQGSDVHGA